MLAGEACYSCLVEQSRRALRLRRLDSRREREVLKRVEEFLEARYSPEAVPALLGTELHRLLKALTACDDPFSEAKARANALAMALLPGAREFISRAKDRFEAAVKVALAGNLLDYGVYGASAGKEALLAALKEEPAINHIPELREKAEHAERVLYLLDNAGEIAFDRLLIEELRSLGLEVTAAVKSKPIINDATLADARRVGLTEVCRVITTGSDVVGVNFGEASQELLREFGRADFVIAKGQGHFETLDDYKGKPLAFLLKAKCTTVAEALKVPQGSGVVLVRR
jgi:hypothetical protein